MKNKVLDLFLNYLCGKPEKSQLHDKYIGMVTDIDGKNDKKLFGKEIEPNVEIVPQEELLEIRALLCVRNNICTSCHRKVRYIIGDDSPLKVMDRPVYKDKVYNTPLKAKCELCLSDKVLYIRLRKLNNVDDGDK